MGDLPPQLAALDRTNINVQSMIVEAALSGSKEAACQAIMLDPLTSALLTLDDMKRMAVTYLTRPTPIEHLREFYERVRPGGRGWGPVERAFDLEATPNFAKLIEDADLPWPPASPIEWPLKDW